ncbi:MAG: TlyA family RNA methyltransferase [Pacificimonas sp.]
MLVERGLAASRARARALIQKSVVFADEDLVTKAGAMVPENTALKLNEDDHPWVSRGALKLVHGIAHFGLDATERTCLDIGASTGGFTEVLLVKGAAKVFAVDVGTNQLHETLRLNPRVVLLEQTDARTLTRDLITEAPMLIVCDASFIGLAKVLARPLSLAAPGATLIALIKPQFEVGPENVGKGGVVRDETVRRRACDDVVEWLGTEQGWTVLSLTESPITGQAGNVEYLVAARAPA